MTQQLFGTHLKDPLYGPKSTHKETHTPSRKERTLSQKRNAHFHARNAHLPQGTRIFPQENVHMSKSINQTSVRLRNQPRHRSTHFGRRLHHWSVAMFHQSGNVRLGRGLVRSFARPAVSGQGRRGLPYLRSSVDGKHSLSPWMWHHTWEPTVLSKVSCRPSL